MGTSPSFAKIQKATSLEALKTLTVPSQMALQKDGNKLLTFKGKCSVIVPPFLTKILMDIDSKDPFVLLQATCKALSDLTSLD
jgi:hypothetical protein